MRASAKWHIGEDGDVYDENEDCVAFVVGAPDGSPEGKTNGRLIAAAPETAAQRDELLAACKKAQVAIFMARGSENEDYKALGAAIAKAERRPDKPTHTPQPDRDAELDKIRLDRLDKIIELEAERDELLAACKRLTRLLRFHAPKACIDEIEKNEAAIANAEGRAS